MSPEEFMTYHRRLHQRQRFYRAVLRWTLVVLTLLALVAMLVIWRTT